jgi:dihydroxy-acid dehydratase
MTDGRFSGGSVGLVIGHVGPEAAIGGPIALIENGDQINVDLNTNELICVELLDQKTFSSRKEKWNADVEDNGGVHPSIGDADTRLLNRMRCSAVSAVFGAGMHPNRNLWVSEPRTSPKSKFQPSNMFK